MILCKYTEDCLRMSMDDTMDDKYVDNQTYGLW